MAQPWTHTLKTWTTWIVDVMEAAAGGRKYNHSEKTEMNNQTDERNVERQAALTTWRKTSDKHQCKGRIQRVEEKERKDRKRRDRIQRGGFNIERHVADPSVWEKLIQLLAPSRKGEKTNILVTNSSKKHPGSFQTSRCSSEIDVVRLYPSLPNSPMRRPSASLPSRIRFILVSRVIRKEPL